MSNSDDKTLSTLKGLLSVGMLDEAIDIGRRELQTHPHDVQLLKVMCGILQAKLNDSKIDDLQGFQDLILDLNLPPQQFERTESQEKLLKIEASRHIRELVTRAEISIRRKESADALRILREARFYNSERSLVARLSAIAILHQLRQLKPFRPPHVEQARPLLREYLREVTPFLDMPSPLHSRMMGQVIRFGADCEKPFTLIQALFTWPEVFWMPADTTFIDDFRGSLLAELINLVDLHITEIQFDLDKIGEVYGSNFAEQERRKLLQRLECIIRWTPEAEELYFIRWGIHNKLKDTTGSIQSLFLLLRQHPNCARGWKLLASHDELILNAPLAIAAICKAILLTPPRTRTVNELHRDLCILLERVDLARESRLEFLLSRQHTKPFAKIPRTLLTQIPPYDKTPYGYQPGEGNYDFYLQQANRVWDYVHQGNQK